MIGQDELNAALDAMNVYVQNETSKPEDWCRDQNIDSKALDDFGEMVGETAVEQIARVVAIKGDVGLAICEVGDIAGASDAIWRSGFAMGWTAARQNGASDEH